MIHRELALFMFFEESPAILILLVVITVEVWLRVREPLFRLVARPFRKSTH